MYTTSTSHLTKPQKKLRYHYKETRERNGVVNLDRKLYNNAIQEIISDTSKFGKLNEDPNLKCEASLQRFLRKLKQQQKNFNENAYDSAPVHIYGTPKMRKSSSNDSFPQLRPIFSSIGTFTIVNLKTTITRHQNSKIPSIFLMYSFQVSIIKI